MEKPTKPTPDFPLYVHASGRWAKKIKGKTHFFGPWEDPQGALANYNAQKGDLFGNQKPKHNSVSTRRLKPKKPRPDFPLFPHASGQWARKINGKTKYFGPWSDPQAAEAAYRAQLSGQFTKSTADNKPRQKPRLPRNNYPLWAHPCGQWAKKIRGTVYYFGTWDDPDAAEEKYKLEKDDLEAGRKPQERKTMGHTISELCEKFMEAKRQLLPSEEISRRAVDDYDRTCAKIVFQFGEGRLIEDLLPEDFVKFRAELAQQYGPTRLANEIIRIRCVFKFAYENRLIENPIRYGYAFSKPKAAVMRREKLKNGKRMFTPDQIRTMLKKANKAMRAMILLGINCGFGNQDCAALPLSAVDLEKCWVDFARKKTYIERSCPLWPETIEALKEYLRDYPKVVNDEFKGLMFITQTGQSWSDGTRRNPITKELTKLLESLGFKRSGLSFYALRHTFSTVGEYCKDKEALEFLMGHVAASSDMRPHYREEIWANRLRAIVDHVHRWVFKKGYAEMVQGAR
jgi:integrase